LLLLPPGIIAARRHHITLLVPATLLLPLWLPGGSTASLTSFGTLLPAWAAEEKNGTYQDHHCNYQASDNKHNCWKSSCKNHECNFRYHVVHPSDQLRTVF
jgi:hypothetical protein